MSVGLLILAVAASPARAVVEETGNFLDETARLKDLAFPKDSDDYDPPTTTQRNRFRAMVTALLAGDFATADMRADQVGYEVVRFNDTVSGSQFLGVREELNNDGEQRRGWGSYFFNPTALRTAVIEAPHILHDSNTLPIAARVFLDTRTFALLFNGAHRDANGEDTADVAHLGTSIFFDVHQLIVTESTRRTVVQLHGWSNDNAEHDDFPGDAEVILSNGDGGVDATAIAFDAAFEDTGYRSYAYNELPRTSATNLLVNDGVNGRVFDTLAATTNVQGDHTREVGASFLHIELEMDLRSSAAGRNGSVAAIVGALSALPIMVPEPGVGALLVSGAVLLAGRRR